MESFLRNRYWVLRHGRSIPNETGLIVSSMKNGILEKYKLADEGIEQARLAGELFLRAMHENGTRLEDVRICYSPFARTQHTAQLVAAVLNIPFGGPQCIAEADLRERFFGPSFELKSHDRYPEIWTADEKNPFLPPEEGGESVSDVVHRLTKALVSFELEFKDCTVLIVSHGDPLQILQTILKAAKEHTDSVAHDLPSRIAAIKTASTLSQHRKYALDTAELRPVP